MEVVCVRARDGVALGESVEVPDGAAVSGMWFAEPGSVEALRAIADAAAAEAVEEPPQAVEEPPEDAGPSPKPQKAAAAALVAPDAAKGM